MKLAIVERARLKWVETELGNRLPPESFGKRMQQHLCPLIVDHHAVLGDYYTVVVVGANERVQGLRIVSTSELGAEIRK